MDQKWHKRFGAVALAAVIAASTSISAGACCGVYVGSEQSANGSTYVGRSEDIGKLYDKVFEVRPAADHADGEMYEDTYGFSMPYPAHTYRYTVMRDSMEMGESVVDANGNLVREAYGEVGMNENGVAMSATVSTANNEKAEAADPLVETGICEISLNSVVLMTAESARDGVEKLAKIIDTYGSGECNSFTISDANEVWDFETLSGHQYVAVKMPVDKVSVNPNMVVMNEIDVSDTENVIASDALISLPLENGFLVSSQKGEAADEKITKIDIQKTYGSEDFGNGQYFRYWQGVNYLNEALSETVSVEREGEAAPEGPFNMLFEADHELTTYEVLRLLAYRGEGTEYAADNNPENNPNGTAIGNERQAECHIFEIRSDMPEALATVQWQAMSRAEFSVYLPYYSNLLTDTSEIFQTEYSTDAENIEEVLDDADFPAETSAYWVFTAINDLCDNDRARYGTNVKLYWEKYQKALIEQQAAVDKEMERIYAESPEQAEKTATALGKAVSEEAFANAKSILTELRAFIAQDKAGELTKDDVFTPTVLTENKMPTYAIDMAVEEETGFDDVSSSAWYADAVEYVVSNGVMNGTGDTTFEPDAALSRSMMVQVLYNMENKPAASDAAFIDVADNAWYADAVAWAAENKLVNGVEENQFAPDDNITREQMAAILYRYAQYKGQDVSARADMNAYTDFAEISSYAEPMLAWAVSEGLITGSSDTTLSPAGNATRAEVAVVLMRYLQQIS